MWLLPIERYILIATGLTFLGSCLSLHLRGVTFEVRAIALAICLAAGLISLGAVYRRFRREVKIPLALISLGLFMFFTMTAAILNYVFLPTAFPSIDPVLTRIDANLGFQWSSFVTAAASYPWIGKVLAVVYSTSFLQLAFLCCWFGFRGDALTLYHTVLTGMLALVLAMSFWVFFPSFGALSYEPLPSWVEVTIPIVSGTTYGRELLRIAAEGPSVIAPGKMNGLIAFPSFHTVMACISVAFAPRPVLLRAAYYLLNLLMLPAILVHGGHHLVDIPGGILCFALAYALAGYLVRRMGETTGPRQTASARQPA